MIAIPASSSALLAASTMGKSLLWQGLLLVPLSDTRTPNNSNMVQRPPAAQQLHPQLQLPLVPSSFLSCPLTYCPQVPGDTRACEGQTACSAPHRAWSLDQHPSTGKNQFSAQG